MAANPRPEQKSKSDRGKDKPKAQTRQKNGNEVREAEGAMCRADQSKPVRCATEGNQTQDVTYPRRHYTA